MKPSNRNTEWCTISTIDMIIIIIKAKSFLKRHFWGNFSKQFLKTNLLFWKKMCCIQQLRCTAKLDRFYANNLVLTKKMAPKDISCRSYKVNLKNLKTQFWLDDLMQATSWRHQLYSDRRFEPLANSAKSLTWAYMLKALKSAW